MFPLSQMLNIVYADEPLGDTLEGLGTLKGPFDLTNIVTTFNTVISLILAVLTALAALVFIFRFFIAGFAYLNAGGDKEAIHSAQQQIQNSIIGLCIVVVAYAIISILGDLLGFDIFNLARTIEKIKP